MLNQSQIGTTEKGTAKAVVGQHVFLERKYFGNRLISRQIPTPAYAPSRPHLGFQPTVSAIGLGRAFL